MEKDKFFKSQNGAIVAEAAFVMPIVIIVVFILVYMALLQIQQEIMYMQAQKMSQKICNITTFPGYEKFYEDAYKDKDDKGYVNLPNSYQPSLSLLDMVYKKHDPYRYLGGVYLNKLDGYEQQISEIIEKSVYFNGGAADAKIDTNFSNLSTSVTVGLSYNCKLPGFVRILGLEPSILISAQAVSYADDTVEFIRNTDIVFDLFDYLLQKYHLKDKINVFYEKIKQVSEKLF